MGLLTPSKEMHIICMMGLGTHTNSIHWGGRLINPLGQQRRIEQKTHVHGLHNCKKQAKV